MSAVDDWEDLELFRALEFYKRGRREESIAVLQRVLKANPRSEQAWLLLAKIVPETDKKVYCFERVLKLNPHNKIAQQALLALRRSPKPASSHPQFSSVTHKGKGTLSGWGMAGILGSGLLIVFMIIGLGFWFSRFPSLSAQTRMVGPITLPPTWTPQPSPTYASFLITGDPIDYLPVLPDRFEIDYSLPQRETTLNDGSKLLIITFRNTQASLHGDLARVVYIIHIFPNEATAIALYRTLVDDVKNGKGTTTGDIKIDRADQSAISIEREENVLSVEFISRVRNAIIMTTGLTIYDPQEVTEDFLKRFVAKVTAVHVLGVEKLSK